ncbi:MAG: hypothetical protein CMLOHMNK_01961 [Steroidobacteraceae bacterium]|nr:hypothetical protein [Steroidobacteraceae bacterium]
MLVAKITLSQPMIDVVRPEPAHEPVEEVQLLDRARGSREDTQRIPGALQALRGGFQRRLPAHDTPLATLAQHG